jgi:hypothetical protein
MIDTATTATAVAARGTELIQHVTAFPARAVDLARAATALASSTILAGPVPTVNPTEPPGGEKVMTVVGWVGWAVFVAAVAGVLVICIKMATNAHKNRSGDGGGEEAGKLFWPLLACIVGSSAGAILGVVA